MFRKEVILPIIIILLCVALCALTKKLIYKFYKIRKKKIDGRQKSIINLVTNVTKAFAIILSILIIFEVWGIDTKTLLASLGIVGLITGLAVQDLLKDFIVGFSIIFENQFSIGDWITIDGFKGEVLPSNLRTTKLRAYSGEVKIIYNRNITEVINHTTYDNNMILDIDVSYDSNIKKVKKVLDELCLKFKEQYNLKNIECLGIQELTDSSIRFRLVICTSYIEQFEIGRELKKEIVIVLKQNDITIPYKQVVIHDGKRI